MKFTDQLTFCFMGANKKEQIAGQSLFNFNLFVNLRLRSNEILEICLHRSVVPINSKLLHETI